MEKFDPLSPSFIQDPYPSYRWLRENDPMHLVQGRTYLASRAAEVGLILKDRRFGKNFMPKMIDVYGESIAQEPSIRYLSHWMATQNPPEHTRLRSLVVRAFSAMNVESLRPRIHDLVADAIDRLEERGSGDLIGDFAFRLPVFVICDLLGVPDEDREMFFSKEIAEGLGRLLDPVPLTRSDLDRANRSYLGLLDYFTRLFDLRRRRPQDDLISLLVQAEADGSSLSNDELCSNILLLFGAGHETTANLIGNGLLALHRNPDQLQMLARDPSLIGNAIEEFLRYEASIQSTGRVALEDIGELGGKDIRKGDSIVCLLGSANRDPAICPDRPEDLDITRQPIRVHSFGGGIHYCLGAQLARVEATIALTSILSRLPRLQLDDIERPQWHPTFALRGLSRLPAHC